LEELRRATCYGFIYYTMSGTDNPVETREYEYRVFDRGRGIPYMEGQKGQQGDVNPLDIQTLIWPDRKQGPDSFTKHSMIISKVEDKHANTG